MIAILRALRETVLFIWSVVFAALRSIRENSGLAALSVVLAFGLWIFVTDAENPTRTRTLPEGIPVEAVNVPQDLAVDEITPAEVRIRIRVEEDVFDSLTAADFRATVDLRDLTAGQYELPVDVDPLTRRGGLRLEDVTTERISVTLAQLVSKSVPVEVEVQGEAPVGYVMSAPKADDLTALVTGPQERVGEVAKAVAAINVEARTEDVDQAVRLVPRDARGLLVQGVNLDPDITQVSIDIEQQDFSRSVAISPKITGSPAGGYNVISVNLSPPSVTVHGSRAFVQSVISISTREVNIEGANDNVVRSVPLDLPAGATVSGGSPVVTVTVDIEPALGQLTLGVSATAKGLAEGLSIVGPLPLVQVTLFGPLPALLALSPSDLSATIDLTGKDAGTHRVAVEVPAPTGAQVRSITPAEVEVTLEQR